MTPPPSGASEQDGTRTCPWCGWEAGMAPGETVTLRLTSDHGDGLRYYRCPTCHKRFVSQNGGEPQEAV